MKKSTILIVIGLLALFILPKIIGGIVNIIGIAIVIGLIFVLFNENLRKRITQIWKFYNRTKRK